MKPVLVVVLGAVLLALVACSGPQQNLHKLKVETIPADAMVSLSLTGEFSDQGGRVVVGPSPLEKDFNFGEANRLWLSVERRGYQPEVVEVQPETGAVSISLNRLTDEKSGEPIKDYSLAGINRLLVIQPDFKIINRMFSGEKVAEADSQQAREAMVAEIGRYFSPQWDLAVLESSADNGKLLNSVWRDARSSMEFVDPIRLPYLAHPPCLETKSSRQAACKLGEMEKAQALLLISGKQNRESASLIIGKIGMTAIGTASSYAGGYSRALERGDSFFVYNVYTPDFAQGTGLTAALIDSASGEILWINKGVWGPLSFNDPETVKLVVEDLFSGLHEALPQGGK